MLSVPLHAPIVCEVSSGLLYLMSGKTKSAACMMQTTDSFPLHRCSIQAMRYMFP